MGSSEYSCLIHRPLPSLKECMVSLVGNGVTKLHLACETTLGPPSET